MFGFGPTMLAAMGAAITPWIDERPAVDPHDHEEHAARVGREHLGVPAGKWHGTMLNGSPDVVNALLDVDAIPKAAIGILGSEVYDGAARLAHRAGVPRVRISTRRTTRTRRRPRATRRTCATVTTRCGRRRSGWTTSTARTPVNADARYVDRHDRGPPGDAGAELRARTSSSPASASCPTARCACSARSRADRCRCTSRRRAARVSSRRPSTRRRARPVRRPRRAPPATCRDGYCEEF